MLSRRCSLSLPIAFHIFNILQQVPRLPCLTIDNRIAIVANDCYTRISIGSKLSNASIVSRVEVASLTECEERCSKKKNTCNAFTFGVDSNGNRTCAISNRVPMFEDLETHPDYDVYIKKRQGAIWCNVDRLYEDFNLGSVNRSIKIVNPNEEEFVTNVGDSVLNPTSMPSRALLIPSYGLIGVYDLHVDHDRRFLSGNYNRRVSNILANRNEKSPSSSSSVAICHRKLQPGKKVMELLVERIVNCENVQDCHRACDYEKGFVCKGFNYRRGTNGSKDTCELTSTPYFRMNVDRDFLTDYRYDYYERDRNCFSPVQRGDTERSTNHRDAYEQNRRKAWFQLDPSEETKPDFLREAAIPPDRSFHRKFYSTNREFIPNLSGEYARPNKQFPYETPRDFNSRENARNWKSNWRNTESRYSDTANHVNYFHGHRVDYSERHSNLRPATLSKSWPEERSLPRGFFNPRENEHFYGKFYNYGSAFGYSDDHMPIAKEFNYEEREKDIPRTSKCSLRIATGSKLNRNVLRKTCLARDLKQCEDFCTNETTFPCESFAYRYNVLTTNPTDNCLLSDLSRQNLNFYTDLEPDRDYFCYVMSEDSKICHSERTTNRYPPKECFSRVKSGFGIPMDIMKKSILVNDLGGCQYACAMSQEFVCKSFAFKYATEYHDRIQERLYPNCFLTDWSSGEINPADMIDMDGAELYERNSFPYGCEAYAFPISVTDLNPPSDKDPTVHTETEDACYSEYHRPCKLMLPAIAVSTRAITKSDCCQKCSTMRDIDSIPCMSFSYTIATDNTRDNCLLSNISARDLRPHLDYTYDDEHALYAWKDLDPYCSLTVNRLNSLTTASASEEYGQPLSPISTQSGAQSAIESGTHSHGPIFDSLLHARSQLKHESHKYDYESGYYAMDNFDAGPQLVPDRFRHEFRFSYPNEFFIFRRYTVNGHPCKNGSVCQQNELAGFWSCEIEESEYGNWDYCCEPNHRCGFSQGYHYPWCYVGSNDDQWRPCSETYYPYYLPKDHRSFYPRLPTYLARHWPVIYLHETLPPNCTVSNPSNQNLNQYH